MAKTTVDPFESALTIASACNRVFRTCFLKDNTIGIIPANGYRAGAKQSIIGMKWLKWLAHTRNIDIQHAGNGPEQSVGPYKVDGMYGNTVFEFNGCYWHGCKQCMKNRTHMTAGQILTAQQAYERTIDRSSYIQQCGYVVEEIWECELKTQLARNTEMEDFFQKIEIIEPINARDGKF